MGIYTNTMTLEGGHGQERSGRISENLPQACNKTNEETYSGPLLVNIKLI